MHINDWFKSEVKGLEDFVTWFKQYNQGGGSGPEHFPLELSPQQWLDRWIEFRYDVDVKVRKARR